MVHVGQIIKIEFLSGGKQDNDGNRKMTNVNKIIQ